MAEPQLALDVARIARVVDLETTGFPEDMDAEICEAAKLDVDLTADGFPIIADSAWSSLIKPLRPIPPVTMAVHHITNEDVADAPPHAAMSLAFGAGMSDQDVYVAHKADFEQHFYPKKPQRWVCTYKCALRAWPDAPGHSNQVLRYHLQLPVDPVLAMPPHRALPDCRVTAEILRLLLGLRPLDRLVEISSQPGFLPKFNFGKHTGKSFQEVAETDRSYLVWIVEKSDMDRDIKFTAKHWLGRR